MTVPLFPTSSSGSHPASNVLHEGPLVDNGPVLQIGQQHHKPDTDVHPAAGNGLVSGMLCVNLMGNNLALLPQATYIAL